MEKEQKIKISTDGIKILKGIVIFNIITIVVGLLTILNYMSSNLPFNKYDDYFGIVIIIALLVAIPSVILYLVLTTVTDWLHNVEEQTNIQNSINSNLNDIKEMLNDKL